MNKSLKFIEKKPTRCDHRYARIPGKSSTFLAKADGRLLTDTGWEVVLGRGLDIYKRPEDFAGIGASDFALRPCYKTRVFAHRISDNQNVRVVTGA